MDLATGFLRIDGKVVVIGRADGGLAVELMAGATVVVRGEGTVDKVVLADICASYAGTLRLVVAELCATLLKMAAMFFSRAVWSRLNAGLLGPPSLASVTTVRAVASASTSIIVVPDNF